MSPRRRLPSTRISAPRKSGPAPRFQSPGCRISIVDPEVAAIGPRTSPEAADPLARSLPRLHRALAARLGCDELYAATFGRLCAALATAATALDRSVWDGSIRLLARLGAYTGLVSRETEEDVLNGGFNAAGDGLRAGGRAYSRTQTGDAHGYVWMLAAGFVLLALAVLLGGVR